MDQYVNTTISSPGGDYNMSIVAKFFHQIPHRDIHLNWVNSTFDLQDNQYLEALGIIVAIPGFWLILTLFFFLIFFLCRCCDVNSRKEKKLTCCKCCLFHLTLFSIAVILVGMYGNYQSHEGLIKVQNSTSSLAQNIGQLENLTQSIKKSLEEGIYANFKRLDEDKVTGPLVKNYTIVEMLKSNITRMMAEITIATQKMDNIESTFFKFNLGSVTENVKEQEFIRMAATWAVFGSLLLIGFVLVCGICKHSRCLLILFSVLGLLSLVICWVLTSIYIGICVAASDYCMDPKPFLYKQLSKDIVLVNYYLQCDERPNENIYRNQVEKVKSSLDSVEVDMRRVRQVCDVYCDDVDVKRMLNTIVSNLHSAKDNLNTFDHNSDCVHVYRDYLSTMNHTCKDILEGVSLMLASSAVTGLIFTLLVLCASHTWINIRKKAASPISGETNDETAPFLPPTSASSTASSSAGNFKRMRDNYPASSSSSRPRFSHTPPQTPHFPPGSGYMASAPQMTGPTSNGRSKDEHLPFLTPPPSYDQVGIQQLHPHHHTQHGQPVVGPHYVADNDLLMRATQATKF